MICLLTWKRESPYRQGVLGDPHSQPASAHAELTRKKVSLQRVCFVLRVRPDRLEEYRERHRHVWPEMQEALRRAGWGDYTLFLAPDGLLVGYLTCDDFQACLAAMQTEEVNQRWQEQMAPFFLSHSPADQAMVPLEEVFHID